MCKRWLVSSLLFAALVSWGDGQARAEQSPLNAATIRAALRTDPIEEKGFIDRVVDLMDQGVLPRAMVQSTFNWARKKPTHKFQYFRFGMVVRAAAIGVRL
jgi:hypothetical protein